MPICKITDLNKAYQLEDRVIRAIINCNLEIKKGECVAVSGSRDSGKSTLLRILGGLERPTSGDIFINNVNLTHLTDDELVRLRRNEVGYLFQDDTLIPELTVRENIMLPTILAHKKYDKVFYKELIERLNLGPLLNYYPKFLNSRQLAYVAYARALIHKPNIILVDEPSDDLEDYLDKEIFDFLLNMVYHFNKTLILVSNDADINIFVDRIIRLQDGEVVEDRRIS